MKKEDMERVCFNCNNFFPASFNEMTEFGICLNESAFEPFLNELLENLNFDCCMDLIENKKFIGDQEACERFSPVESVEIGEIANDSVLGKAILSLAKNGELNRETFMEAILNECIENIDWKTVPVDHYTKSLKSFSVEERKDAINSLGSLMRIGNKAAFKELFNFFIQLPPPATIEEVHLKIAILDHLKYSNPNPSLIHALIKELYKTTSNNTTRQWISNIFKFFETCPVEEIRTPLKEMLKDKRFSYKLKQKIRYLLFKDNMWEFDDC